MDVDPEEHPMFLALMRGRLRALLFTVALGVAAPRIARGLRRYGEGQRRRGGSTMRWKVPLGAAQALELASGRRGHAGQQTRRGLRRRRG